MSVCYVANDGTMQIQEESTEGGSGEETTESVDTRLALEHFWEWVMEDIRSVTHDSFKSQVLPLARVKRIMKLDEDVKMISAEAPMLFAKAAEIFIHELTLRAWSHTEDNKRRTLQRNDIAMAIIKSDQFDFLIDIVPRQELKTHKAKEETKPSSVVSQDQVHYYLQLAQQHQAALQSTTGAKPAQIITPTTLVTPQQVQQQVQQVQQQTQQQQNNSATSSTSTPSSSTAQFQQAQHQQQTQPLQIVQQVVTSTGEIQQIPIQLSPNQMQLIRMQMQSNSGQPIIIQTNPGAQQQVMQVQPSQPQQYYLTIASSENE